MEEKKENKGSIIAIIVLACVTLLLSFVIWNLGKKVIEVSDENRKLQQEISEKAVTTVTPVETVDETTAGETTPAETVEPTE